MYIDINTNMYTKEYTFVYTLCKDDLYYIIRINIYIYIYTCICIHIYILQCIFVHTATLSIGTHKT